MATGRDAPTRSKPIVAVRLRDSGELALLIEQGRHSLDHRVFSSDEELLIGLAPGQRWSVVVHDVQPFAPAATLTRVLDAARATSTPTIIRIASDPIVGRTIMAASHTQVDAQLSVRGFDRLADDLASVARAGTANTPTLRLVRELTQFMPATVEDILVAAAVIGRRRQSVVTLASACGLPVRTLEWRLATAHVLEARRLLGKILAVYAAWNLQVLRWSTKRAAADAGFSTPAAFCAYLRRHCDMTPAVLARSIEFDALVASVAEGIKRPIPGSQTPPLRMKE